MASSKTRLRERAVLVGIGLKSEGIEEIKLNLSELSELAESAGAEVVGTLTQAVESYNPATLMGSGKVLEVKELVKDCRGQIVIVDHELSGVQCRNLQEAIEAPVIDRTQLILDIFAVRAQTFEGKLQVELALLLDLNSRMVGAWHGSLSRQGGGIGTRGPGESAIETDRRVIRDKITHIRRELELVKQNRSRHRNQRRKNKIPSIAMIGYTNAGKSTLLNRLTHAEVYAQDQLFATLDPTTRKLFLPDSPSAVLTDTVGFIRKLPTHLIEAFKATLEESGDAEILMHVIDISSPVWERQVEAVDKLIEEFGWQTKPILHVFNKIDVSGLEKRFRIERTPRVFVSAVSGEGLDQLKGELGKAIQNLYSPVQLFFKNDEKHLVYDLARDTRITSQEESSLGVVCVALLTPQLLSKWNKYLA